MKPVTIDLNASIPVGCVRSAHHFVYSLSSPEAPAEWKYVGVTQSPLVRLAQHITGDSTTCEGWVVELLSTGQFPVMTLLEAVAIHERNTREQWWIREGLRKGFPLTNRVSQASRDLATFRLESPRSSVPEAATGAVLLTPSQVAQLIVRSTQTLANWRVQGRGPRHMNLGGRVLYRREDVMDWIDDAAGACAT